MVIMSAKTDPRCPKCKGQFSSGGVETRKIPLGFGFKDSSAFQVDFIEVKSYTGFCMDCGKDGNVEFSRRKVTEFPKSINQKLGKAVKGKTKAQIKPIKPKKAGKAPSSSSAPAQASDELPVGVTHNRSWTWVKFAEKPSDEVLSKLSELGGRFTFKRMAWYFTHHIDPGTFKSAGITF
jgi:hypothetical protein